MIDDRNEWITKGVQVMLDFRMDTFLMVCRYLNYTKAAEALNITQPAVSQHIHYLEEIYSVKLFSYEGKKLFLTEPGKSLYQAAITMKHDEQYLKEMLMDSEQRRNRLTFGATLTIGEFVMAQSLERYLRTYPDSQIQMVVGNTSELIELLDTGEIDFALVEGNYDKKKYNSQIFAQERYIPVCSKHHCFSKQPEKLADLLTERIIIREKGSGTREILERNLEYRNLEIVDFAKRVEIGGITAIKSLVEADLGITFLYEAAVRKELQQGEISEIELKDFKVSHDFAFIWNKGSIFSQEYQHIFELLKQK